MVEVTSISVRSPYLIYALVDPRTGEVRYVGKSTSGLKRPKKHFYPSTLSRECRTRRVKWINSLLKQGLKPEIRVLDVTHSPEFLGDMEKEAIASLRSEGADLVNGTDGGEGSYGRKQGELTRRKISEARRGRPGTPHTEEHKLYMSRLLSGRSHSEASKEKMRKAQKGRSQSRETIEKQVVARKRYTSSEEWRVKKSRVHGGKAVVETGSGTIYGSQSEAARVLGLNPGNIANVLYGRQKSTGGYRFEYAR